MIIWSKYIINFFSSFFALLISLQKKIIIDNQHRGFGFVEFEEADDAQAAIDNMNLSELYGKVIKVNLARPMKVKEGSTRAGNNNYY